MSTLDVIRAWRDELFRKSLSEDELALLPAHPSGEILLSEEEMAAVQGGDLTDDGCSCGCYSGSPDGGSCAPPCQIP